MPRTINFVSTSASDNAPVQEIPYKWRGQHQKRLLRPHLKFMLPDGSFYMEPRDGELTGYVDVQMVPLGVPYMWKSRRPIIFTLPVDAVNTMALAVNGCPLPKYITLCWPGHVSPEQLPPAQDPLAQDPPAQDPPAQAPPAQAPPAQAPPAQHPPAKVPPAQVPPAQVPPAQVPACQPPQVQPLQVQAPPAQVPTFQPPQVQPLLAQAPPVQDFMAPAPLGQNQPPFVPDGWNPQPNYFEAQIWDDFAPLEFFMNAPENPVSPVSLNGVNEAGRTQHDQAGNQQDIGAAFPLADQRPAHAAINIPGPAQQQNPPAVEQIQGLFMGDIGAASSPADRRPAQAAIKTPVSEQQQESPAVEEIQGPFMGGIGGEVSPPGSRD